MDVVIAEAIGIAAFVVLAGFCSAAKEALSVVESREQLRGVTPGVTESDTLLKWWLDRRRSVAMLLRIGHLLGIIGATVLSVNLAYLGGAEALSLVYLVVGLTVAGVLFCHVIPATLARSHPQPLARFSIRLVRLPYVVLFPVTALLLQVRAGLLRVVGEDKAVGDRLEVLGALRAIFAERPHLEERQMLLRTVTGFPDVMVREVMVPRTDMIAISKEMTLDEILVTLLECGHSRIPVYGESADEIIGLFYAKDVIQLMASGRDFDIEEFLRQPYFVPETKPIDALLSEFQKKRIHMAVVVDEFGGTAGLITLEDIMEEFFGDIQDEYDVEPAQLVEIDETKVIADARINIDEIEDYFDVEFPESSDYDSLGGFLLSRTGNVPQAGDEIRWEQLNFRILEADAKRIDTVEIEVLAPVAESPQELAS